MKFGPTPVADSAGAILAHSTRAGSRAIKKGRVLSEADIASLKAAGLVMIVTARLEAGEIGEDVAARRLAESLAGNQISAAVAFTGRANLFAEVSGLCLVERDDIDRFNAIDEAITLATLAPFSVVTPKQMVATVKIIPFAVTDSQVAKAEAAVRQGRLIRVAPFRQKRVALIQTRLAGMKESILDKTADVTRARLAALGSELIGESRVDHDEKALAPAIAQALKAGANLVLVAGASAILDRRDVIPASIVAAGGAIEHFGMPVDPGNLLLLGRIGAAPVLGLPGCARSPKENGFDRVLRLLCADLPADAAAIQQMGVGGLLAEIPSRPLPRAQATPLPASPRPTQIAALVLAAGQSRRMGAVNKLLIAIDGKPMLRHAVDAVLAAGIAPVVVVTGHEHTAIETALAGLPVAFAANPDYAQGLSTSLRHGLAALPEGIDGALVVLGDMPRVEPAELRTIVGAFSPNEGRAIVVPTRHGKRGNPVLWGRQFFAEMQELGGDVGARHLIGAYPEAVAEVEMAGDGVLTDIDTPQALARLKPKIEA
jgi:molybdenum cofactor cytidylyltransferase